LKGLESIKYQQLATRELIQTGEKPFLDYEGDTNHYASGVVLPIGKHYQIDREGEISLTEPKFLSYLDKKEFPPFSAAEMMLDTKNDFNIDYAKAAEFYTRNKELAIKENENILASREYKPDHPLITMVKQEINEVQEMLQGQDAATVGSPAVSALMDLQLDRVNKLLEEYSEQLEKTPAKDVPQLEFNFRQRLSQVFADLKNGLKQLFVDVKDQAKTGVENKINGVKTGIQNTVTGVKIDIHNSIASRVQNVNNKIKHFTDALDVRYQIIDKEKALGKAPASTEEKAATTFSKREAEALIKSHMDNHKGLRSDIEGEESLSLRNDMLTMKFRPQQGEGQHIVTVDLNSGESRLDFEYQGEHRSEKDYLESFNLHEVRGPQQVQQAVPETVQEASEKAPVVQEKVEPALTEKEATDLLKPYMESLKADHPDLHNDKQSVKVQDNELTLRMYPKESSTNYHVAKVNLQSGEGKLEFHYLDPKQGISGVDELKNFNLKQLRPDQPVQDAAQKTQEAPESTKVEFINTDKVQDIKGAPEAPAKSAQDNKEIAKLNKQVNGFKTFINMVKDNHPDAYQAVKNELNGVQPTPVKEEPKADLKLVSKQPKVKSEALEL
jgi:hypothetical protein